jgi:hypothetical protein
MPWWSGDGVPYGVSIGISEGSSFWAMSGDAARIEPVAAAMTDIRNILGPLLIGPAPIS